MTNPISNERLAELLHFCSVNDDSWTMSNAEVQALASELQSRRQSPAGVEPVAYLTVRGDEQRVVLAKFVTPEALNVSNGWAHIPLYASPPKAVTITEEMVERAVARFEEIEKDETEYSLQDGIRELLTAALSSEDHNG